MQKYCFNSTPPIARCTSVTEYDNGYRCSEYEYEEGKPETYQLFVVPNYIKPTSAPRNTIEDNTEIMHNQLVEN